jgi:hypothetical protein
MNEPGGVTLDLDLAFPTAAVGFTVQVRESSAEAGAPLLISLRALEAGKEARFSADSSYALADFVGGLCRWLGTKGVTVSHTEREISGYFHQHHTVPHLLAITQELCQMLEDKFAGYPSAIIQ